MFETLVCSYHVRGSDCHYQNECLFLHVGQRKSKRENPLFLVNAGVNCWTTIKEPPQEEAKRRKEEGAKFKPHTNPPVTGIYICPLYPYSCALDKTTQCPYFHDARLPQFLYIKGDDSTQASQAIHVCDMWKALLACRSHSVKKKTESSLALKNALKNAAKIEAARDRLAAAMHSMGLRSYDNNVDANAITYANSNASGHAIDENDSKQSWGQPDHEVNFEHGFASYEPYLHNDGFGHEFVSYDSTDKVEPFHQLDSVLSHSMALSNATAIPHSPALSHSPALPHSTALPNAMAFPHSTESKDDGPPIIEGWQAAKPYSQKLHTLAQPLAQPMAQSVTRSLIAETKALIPPTSPITPFAVQTEASPSAIQTETVPSPTPTNTPMMLWHRSPNGFMPVLGLYV